MSEITSCDCVGNDAVTLRPDPLQALLPVALDIVVDFIDADVAVTMVVEQINNGRSDSNCIISLPSNLSSLN
eukprot:7612437-Prorocentrum_lima.AAC.1